GSPIAEPHRAPIIAINRGDNQFHAVLDPVVTGDRARDKQVRLWITSIVLDETRIALAVGLNERAHDTKASPLAVEVLAVAHLRTIGDDAFDIPLASVEKKTDER